MDEAAPIRTHRLTPSEVPQATDLLVRTFARDPFVDWLVRSDARRDEGMRRFFTVCLHQLTMPFGEVWATADMDCVALWVPPGRYDLGLVAQARFAWQAVRGMQLRHAPSRFAGLNQIERRHPTPPHFYLMFLAVDPTRQGLGLGSRMVADMLARCDADGTPSYLEATTEALIPYYERHGYRPVDPVAIVGGPTLHPMWREPRVSA